ncbi:hypothetical protein B0H14DRAFT_3535641 [Mycena olivaceomarginata]|nr:hypothetical protein B0H14DRAFT_3535641 [Mycena olivaceomarginata]
MSTQINDTPDNFAGWSVAYCYARHMKIFPSGLRPFPAAPTSLAAFAATNLTIRPTFFGCTPSSSPSAGSDTDTNPGLLLIYIANGAPPRDGAPALTNTTTGQLIYTLDEIQGMLKQMFDIATQGAIVELNEKTVDEDPEWGGCLACAVVDLREGEGGCSEKRGVQYVWLREYQKCPNISM